MINNNDINLDLSNILGKAIEKLKFSKKKQKPSKDDKNKTIKKP